MTVKTPWPTVKLEALAGKSDAYQGHAVAMLSSEIECIVFARTPAMAKIAFERVFPDLPINMDKVYQATMVPTKRVVVEGDDEL
jgi:hypothetical protein